MIKFLARKIPSLLFVIVASSVVAFALPRMAPGDPAQTIAGPDASPEQVQAIRESAGLTKPIIEQYFDWAGGVLRGSFGLSYVQNRPVADLITSRLESTLELALLAALLMIVIGFGLGILAGSARSWISRVVLEVINTGMLAIPPFLVGLLLILGFGVYWRLLPVSGDVGLLADPAIGIQFLILPALALALSQAAVIARLLATQMQVARGEDYIDLAIAKGASPRRVAIRHVLRNSMGAAVVAIGLRIGELLGGSIVIEAIFARGGLGSLAVQSVNTRDYFVIQTLIVGAVVIAVLSQLMTEIILAALDPRIRLEA